VADDHIHVDSKTPAGNRDIPLNLKTRRLIDKMRGFDADSMFGLHTNSLDALLLFQFIEATINSMEIEFNSVKDAANIKKHGVSLEIARELAWEEAYA
jgi:hypothetical protein